MSVTDLIGKSLGTKRILVDRSQLKLFAKVLGEKNPVYFDETAAHGAGYPSLLVPPTYFFCLEMSAFDSIGHAVMLNMNPERILHGEQEFHYHKPAFAGDVLQFDLSVTDAYQKKNGALEFVVKESLVTNQDGVHIADLHSIIVQKNG